MQQPPDLTELEQTKLALFQARRATFAAQKIAIQLAERVNEEEDAALQQGIRARLDAAQKEAVSNVELAELRKDGQVKDQAAA